MKKILISILLIFTIIWTTFAWDYKLTAKDKIIINKINYKIKPLLEKQTLAFRQKLESKINELQQKYKSNQRFYYIFEQIKNDNYMFNHKLEYTNHYKDFKIDYEKVKSTWLKRHNDVRRDLWVTPYSYDKRLDNTWYEWSKKQRSDWFISHKKYWDTEFYNYKVVEKWFNDRWVKCKVSGWATSSESIWKFGYGCTDSDCTDEFLESLKVIFDIYMDEKDLWYPADAHYRWITLWSLKKMGIWLAFYKTDKKDDYEYYMTTHYCTEFMD